MFTSILYKFHPKPKTDVSPTAPWPKAKSKSLNYCQCIKISKGLRPKRKNCLSRGPPPSPIGGAKNTACPEGANQLAPNRASWFSGALRPRCDIRKGCKMPGGLQPPGRFALLRPCNNARKPPLCYAHWLCLARTAVHAKSTTRAVARILCAGLCCTGWCTRTTRARAPA